MKSTFWQWLTNPKAEEQAGNIMPEEKTTHAKPIGIREIALGVYLGSLMVAGTAFVLWFIWAVFKS